MKATIDELHAQAQTNLLRAQSKQKQFRDRDANARPLVPGDRVMLFTPQLRRGRSSKFHKPWSGPFRVLRQPRYPGVTYAIEDESNGRVVVAHRNSLKLWPPPDSAPVIEYAPAVEGGEGEVGGGDGALLNEEPREEALPVPKPEAQEVVGNATHNERREARVAEQPRDSTHDRDENAVGDAGAARDAGEVRGAGVGQGSVLVGDGRGAEAKHVAHRVGRPPRGGARPIAEPPLRHSTRDRHPPRRFGDEKTSRLGNSYE